jgi:electron-transferring-flavoprotein dehydrogenase
MERSQMEADIVCVGFGPAVAGFLTTLSGQLTQPDGSPRFESAAVPGLPPQVIAYERADDLSFGVSGVVTRARALRETWPEIDPGEIPMATPVTEERLLYLLDPIGASRRSPVLRLADRLIRAAGRCFPSYFHREAFRLPYTPPFLRKEGGLVLSMGQFMQWVGSSLMASGTVQVWPGTPVASALIEDGRVVGIRMVDQGTDRQGQPEAGFMPGMDIRAALTVVGDGPVGPVGRQLDERFGMPLGNHQRDWAVGMKMVVDLPAGCELKPGTVFHTFGFPEPEIFGFLYVHPGGVASCGIFVPSWLDSPVRTSYRYLQHWMMHPYLWRYLEGGTLRSWGAKSLQESGRRGEPLLVGEGYARVGEGSGSTNVLTGSGLDEAWKTGTLLAEGVLQLLEKKLPFTRENLTRAYVERRRRSWLDKESRQAEKARDGFSRGLVTGLIGMALSGLSGGKLSVPGRSVPPWKRLPTLEEYYQGRVSAEEVQQIRQRGGSLHSALMERCGWPAIPYDGKLLVSHQDALLMGGKVCAPAGYADHVVAVNPELCRQCSRKVCVEICSGQALTVGPEGAPILDREKCVHCGACVWSCSLPHPHDPERSNIELRAGAGGLHSAEN